MRSKSFISEKFVSVGTVKDAFGLKGEVFISLRAHSMGDWLEEGALLTFLSPEEEFKSFELINFRPHKTGVVVKLKGVDNRTQAEFLKRWLYLVDTAQLKAPLGEKPYLAELVGVKVQNVAGEVIGIVESVHGAPTWDVLQVRGEKAVLDVPFLEAWVKTMDLENKLLIMDLPAEFLDPDFWKA